MVKNLDTITYGTMALVDGVLGGMGASFFIDGISKNIRKKNFCKKLFVKKTSYRRDY